MSGTSPGTTIAVIVVTFNSENVIGGLIESLGPALEGLQWHLTVADNDSTDRTVEVVRQTLPQARIVPTGRNGGYAFGINAAAATLTEFDAALVLNPDVRLAPGSGRHLVEVLRRRGGIVVPVVTMADGSPEYNLRREPTVLRALGDALIGAERAGRSVRFGEVVTDRTAYERESTSDWAVGSAMLISRSCWDATAPWDESFFMYSEETDFALRARDAGFTTTLAPQAKAVHIGGDSRVAAWLWRLLVLNRVRLYRRRHNRVASTLFWAAVLLREASRAALGNRPSRAAARALLSAASFRETPGPPAPSRPVVSASA